MNKPSVKFTTDVATAQYPYLHAKDSRFSKKADGSDAFYKINLILQGAAAKALLKEAKALIKRAMDSGYAKSPPKLPGEWDKATETLMVRCKSGFKPALFDAAGNPTEVVVGGGSKVRASLNMVAYDGFGSTGVTLYVNAVQVLELVEGGGAEAGAFGFDATEGFVDDSPPAATPTFDDTPDEDFDTDEFESGSDF